MEVTVEPDNIMEVLGKEQQLVNLVKQVKNYTPEAEEAVVITMALPQYAIQEAPEEQEEAELVAVWEMKEALVRLTQVAVAAVHLETILPVVLESL